MGMIKFRIWHGYIKGYLTLKGERFYYEPLNVEHIELIAEQKKNFIGGDSMVLEQYTGLKDKNSVEIYEGDILQSTYLNEDDEKATLECLWSKEFIGFEFVDHKRPHVYYCSIEEEFEVIGNIHEKGEKEVK